MRKNWNNYTVQYKHHGNIIKIYEYSDIIYCVINKFNLIKTNVFSKFGVHAVVDAMQAFYDYFLPYEDSNDHDLVKIDYIINKCIIYGITGQQNKRISILTPCVSFEHD